MSMDEGMFMERYNSIEAFVESINAEHFVILESIGEGAFSKIYKGRVVKDTCIKMPDVVALKIMEKRHLEKNNVSNMGVHESKLLAILSNNFIIKYYASFSTIDQEYIVMECLRYNLFSIIRSKLYLGEASCRSFGSQILLGLEYLHNFNIANRDLKPENIVVGTNGCIKISDLSFAKYIHGRTYTSIGTVEYMAPEVILGEGHGIAVDWWAFGVLLYEMCAGHSPFNTSHNINLIKNIIKAKIKFPLTFTEELKDLIKRLLVVDVTQRFGNLKGKINDIKKHSWFNEDVDWHNLKVGKYNLPRELIDFER